MLDAVRRPRAPSNCAAQQHNHRHHRGTFRAETKAAAESGPQLKRLAMCAK